MFFHTNFAKVHESLNLIESEWTELKILPLNILPFKVSFKVTIHFKQILNHDLQ